MRFRLQTSTASHELPQLKAWFAFSATDDTGQPQSIVDLKTSICSIKAFAQANIAFRDLCLELDGFELLDDLSAQEVLRDGDLIIVKRTNVSARLGKKRKAEDEGFKTERGKRPRRSTSKAKAQSSSSSSSSPSPSSSSDSSSSDSSESSDSSSDSSDSESDSSSSDPSVVSLKVKPRLNAKSTSRTKIKPSVEQTHVPPGLGSAQTRKRNVRRRLKKKYETGGAQVANAPLPPKRMSDANVAPLGAHSKQPESLVPMEGQVDPTNNALNLTMFSLGNKNKKKGYKYVLTPSTTQKKVFNALDVNPEQVEAESIPFEVLDEPFPPSTSIFTSARPSVIPPSELASLGKLPKNMFVTSVDVEKGLNLNQSKKKRRKQQSQVEYTPLDDGGGFYDNEGAMELDYGVPEGGDDNETVPNSHSGLGETNIEVEDSKGTLVWSVVESTFDQLPLALLDADTDFQQSLSVGKLVAWKALALNPRTFSPEVLLHIATVTAVSETAECGTVSISRFIRPGWEDLDVEDVEGTYELDSIRAMGWKIVNKLSRT